MAETRRSFFGTLLALVTAPFVAKAGAPEQFSVDIDWSKIPDPTDNWDISHYPFRDITEKHIVDFRDRMGCASPGTTLPINPPIVHHLSPAIDPWPFKPFAEFPVPIEAMQTVTSSAGNDMLIIISGGLGYLVDRHGVAKRL